MALVLLCGYPCSGKTTFARALAAKLKSQGHPVAIVSADGKRTDIDGNDDGDIMAYVYRDSGTEKRYRSEARATVERALDGNTVVILDAANYVKGYRYELWCVARTSNSSYCVVYMDTPAHICASRDDYVDHTTNDDDNSNIGYGENLMRQLVARFEAPNERNRWDKPLFIVRPNSNGGITTNTNTTTLDTTISSAKVESLLLFEPADVIGRVIDCIRGKSSKLAASRATALTVRPDSDIFATFDRLTRAAEASFIASIRSGTLCVGARLPVPGASNKYIAITRIPRVAELRAMRRALLNLTRLHPPDTTSSDEAILEGYVDYVNEQLNT